MVVDTVDVAQAKFECLRLLGSQGDSFHAHVQHGMDRPTLRLSNIHHHCLNLYFVSDFSRFAINARRPLPTHLNMIIFRRHRDEARPCHRSGVNSTH